MLVKKLASLGLALALVDLLLFQPARAVKNFRPMEALKLGPFRSITNWIAIPG